MVLPGTGNFEVGRRQADLLEPCAPQQSSGRFIVFERRRLNPVQPEVFPRGGHGEGDGSAADAAAGEVLVDPVANVSAEKRAADDSRQGDRANNAAASAALPVPSRQCLPGQCGTGSFVPYAAAW